ncbi:DUF2793 domain-containing protein [Parvibaculum sp.]|uniref:DUF2793 domain-containing protein n=1 Tax=Parvibaculum sp. TaxID=2024848 RepID=UPI00262F5B04|nr:DUF2793 domain-containing protein [Parvibaculum sp.]MCW5726860.1 DUF2793 domain-containing protein [Parvibaculum sp.]
MSAETTELLSLPYIVPSQAQKHVTHNEAIRTLDALVQLAVKSRDLAAPPAEPAPGQRHIVAADATGAWTGKDGQVAAWLDGYWHFLAPNTGWLAWVEEEETLLVFANAGWVDFAPAAAAATGGSMLGVNTDADETNRLAVKSDAALFSHDDVMPGTGDMRLVVNKAAAEQTASFLFQDDWSGRAEFGLTGNNDLTFKVSADGTVWKNAIVIDHATARVAFPAGSVYRERLAAPRTFHVRTDGDDGNDGLSDTSAGAFLTLQRAVDIVAGELDLGGFTVTIQLGAGTHAAAVLKPVAGGFVEIVGDEATPSNVVIAGSAARAIDGSLAVGSAWTIAGVRLQTTGSGQYDVAAMIAGHGTALRFRNVDFGAVGSAAPHILALGGTIEAIGNYTISGGGGRHYWVANGGGVLVQSRTITLTGTPAFGTAFAYARTCGTMTIGGNTYAGAATGQRYHTAQNGVINTVAGGATYFPGDSAGATATGGQYI